jgi:aminoglycoside phosphotransferase (APT) family kinase protein
MANDDEAMGQHISNVYKNPSAASFESISVNVKNFEDFEEWFQRNRPGESTYHKSFIHNDFHAYNIHGG